MPSVDLSRRTFLGGSLVAPWLGMARPLSRATAEPEDDGAQYQLYWGDLHNHTAAIGFGQELENTHPT